MCSNRQLPRILSKILDTWLQVKGSQVHSDQYFGQLFYKLHYYIWSKLLLLWSFYPICISYTKFQHSRCTPSYPMQQRVNDAFNTIRLCKRQLSFVFILAILFLLEMVKIIFDHLNFLNYLHYLQQFISSSFF